MRTMFMIALLGGCVNTPDPTTAENSGLQCSTLEKDLTFITVCQDKFVRCYIPGHGGIHCIPLK